MLLSTVTVVMIPESSVCGAMQPNLTTAMACLGVLLMTELLLSKAKSFLRASLIFKHLDCWYCSSVSLPLGEAQAAVFAVLVSETVHLQANV